MAQIRRFISLLGHNEWRAFAELANSTDRCVCDLSEAQCIYPPGIVGLILLAQHRDACGLQTEVILPEDAGVLNYMERINSLLILNHIVQFDRDVSTLSGNRRNPSDTFTEVMTPADTEFNRVKGVVWSYFEREIPGEVQQAFSVFGEVLENIREHSDPNKPGAAFCCVQVQVYENYIDLAFGDLGIGFLSTLRYNPSLPELKNEEEALRGVLLHRYSRISHQKDHRGGGLRQVSNIVATFGGHFKIISRDGVARQYEGKPLYFYTNRNAFPGTLVWIKIPRFRG